MSLEFCVYRPGSFDINSNNHYEFTRGKSLLLFVKTFFKTPDMGLDFSVRRSKKQRRPYWTRRRGPDHPNREVHQLDMVTAKEKMKTKNVSTLIIAMRSASRKASPRSDLTFYFVCPYTLGQEDIFSKYLPFLHRPWKLFSCRYRCAK